MGGGTNTPIVLSIFAAYIFIFLIMGAVGSSIAGASAPTDAAGNAITLTTVPGPDTSWFLSIFDGIAYFFKGIGFSFSALGVLGNSLLFLPLTVTIIYIGASYARGTG